MLFLKLNTIYLNKLLIKFIHLINNFKIYVFLIKLYKAHEIITSNLKMVINTF